MDPDSTKVGRIQNRQLTPHTHTGKTSRDLAVQFSAGSFSKLKYDATVPKGTAVHLLDGGSTRWVVSDLGFLDKKQTLMFEAADVYGITVPEDAIEDIQEVDERPRIRERM